MKKIIAIILTLVMAFGLGACSPDDGLVTVCLLSEYDSEDKTSSYTYDAKGYPTKVVTQETDRYGSIVVTVTESRYDKDGNLLERSQSVDNQKTKHFSYEYNDEGNKTHAVRDYYTQNEQYEETYSYNDKGNLIEFFETMNGKDFVRYTYSYDDVGNMIEEHYDYILGDVHSLYVFEYTHNTVAEYTYHIFDDRKESSYAYVKIYDENDNLIKSETYQDDSTKRSGGAPYRYETWVYDTEGRLMIYSEYRRDELCAQTTYTYNEYGDIVQYSNFKEGYKAVKENYEYVYDQNGNIIEKTHRDPDDIQNIIRYAYDKDGNLVEENCFSRYEIVESTTTYTYDKHGNLIEKSVYTTDMFGELNLFEKYTYVAVRVTPERAEELNAS